MTFASHLFEISNSRGLLSQKDLHVINDAVILWYVLRLRFPYVYSLNKRHPSLADDSRCDWLTGVIRNRCRHLSLRVSSILTATSGPQDSGQFR